MVLAALTRSAPVASDPAVLSCLPSLARLLRAPTLGVALAHEVVNDDAAAVTASAHEAALEAALHVCAASAEAPIIGESGIAAAAAAWLRRDGRTAGAGALEACLMLLATLLQPRHAVEAAASLPQSDAFNRPEESSAHTAALTAALDSLASFAALTLPPPDGGRVVDGGEDSGKDGLADVRTLQLRALGVLSAIMPKSTAETKRSAVAAAASAGAMWLRSMQDAVLRALRARLSPLQLEPVLTALVAASQGVGGTAALLMDRDGPVMDGGPDGGGGSPPAARHASALLTVAVETVKVQVFSHLQGVLLHRAASQQLDPPPATLLSGQATFALCLRLFVAAVELLVRMEDVSEGAGAGVLPLREVRLLASAVADGVSGQVRWMVSALRFLHCTPRGLRAQSHPQRPALTRMRGT